MAVESQGEQAARRNKTNKVRFPPCSLESQQGRQACLASLGPTVPWSDDVASQLAGAVESERRQPGEIRQSPISALFRTESQESGKADRGQGRQTGAGLPGLSLSGPADDVPSLARAVESGDLVL